MKWTPILHGISATAGVVGALALVGAWVAGSGTFLGQSQTHLFSDATNLLLLSIAFGVGTMIHQHDEE